VRQYPLNVPRAVVGGATMLSSRALLFLSPRRVPVRQYPLNIREKQADHNFDRGWNYFLNFMGWFYNPVGPTSSYEQRLVLPKKILTLIFTVNYK
jgi:hypothetical protein